MKFISLSSSPVPTWFNHPDSITNVKNCLKVLDQKSILFITLEQKNECDRLISENRNPILTAALESIRLKSGSLDLSPFDKQAMFDFGQLEHAATVDGVIPAGTSSDEFEKAYERISTIRGVKATAKDYMELFSEVLGRHTIGAKRFVLIDKYAAKGVYAQNASFNRILWEFILQNPGLDVEIHTTIDYNFYAHEVFDDETSPANEKRNSDWYRQAEVDLAAAIDEDRRKVDVRNASLTVYIYRNKPPSHEPANYEFPHDRHVQFEFSASTGCYVSDYFQLGLGVETFSDEQLRDGSGRGADIYPSDASKMWSELLAVKKKLLVGSIVVDSHEFGPQVSDKLEFRRVSRY